MKRNAGLHYWWLLWLALLVSAPLHAEVEIPALKARVTDLTGTLSAQQQAQLEARLKRIETRKGSQIAILILPTTAPESVEQYSLRVAERWQLGRKGIDDGLLILVAVKDRTMRLEVGYGLEGAVPDAIAKRIISETLTPHFRQNDYYGGLMAAVEQLAGLLEGEPLPEPEPRNGGVGNGNDSLFFIIFAAIALGGVIRRIFGKLIGGTLAATVAGITAWIVIGSFIFALIIAIFAFAATLGGGSRFGGINVGRGGGGFGGGGFGGGGGGFGGGGASGRW